MPKNENEISFTINLTLSNTALFSKTEKSVSIYRVTQKKCRIFYPRTINVRLNLESYGLPLQPGQIKITKALQHDIEK